MVEGDFFRNWEILADSVTPRRMRAKIRSSLDSFPGGRSSPIRPEQSVQLPDEIREHPQEGGVELVVEDFSFRVDERVGLEGLHNLFQVL